VIPLGQLVTGFPILEKISSALTQKQEVVIKEIVCLSYPFRETIAELLVKDWQILSQEAKKQYLLEVLR